jgi:hypothetical protein
MGQYSLTAFPRWPPVTCASFSELHTSQFEYDLRDWKFELCRPWLAFPLLVTPGADDTSDLQVVTNDLVYSQSIASLLLGIV